MRLQTVLTTALLFCLGAIPLSAARWGDLPFHVIVDNRGLASVSDGDFGRSRTRNAITSNAAWNGAGLGTIITATVGSIAGGTLGDGIVMINFRDATGLCTGSCIAATLTATDSQGFIRDAEVVTNNGLAWASAGEACSNEFYIEGAMVHEMGHVLGLRHLSTPGATMYPSVSYCNNGPATIEQADRDALEALY